MNDGPKKNVDDSRLKDRMRFFREYYGPIARNSLHGLAVIDSGACSLLYANSRFLASHDLAPGSSFPLACCDIPDFVVSGEGQAADRQEQVCRECPAIAACRSAQESRWEQSRSGGDGLPSRTAEILAIPLPRQLGTATGLEVLIVEKEGRAAAGELTSDEAEREHLTAITQHSADAIIGLDGAGKVRSWNRGAVDIFGYTAEETIGQDFRILVPDDPKAQREYEKEQMEFQRRGILRNHQAKRVGKDGRTVVVTSTSSLVKSPSGEPLGISVICRDVTMEVLLKELIDHQIRAMTVTHEIGDVLHSTASVEEILDMILLGVTAGQGLGFNRAFLALVEEVPVRADEADGPDNRQQRLRGKMAIGPNDGGEAGRIWKSLSSQRLNLVELYHRYREQSPEVDSAVNQIVNRIDVPLAQKDHVLVRALHSRQALNVMQGKVIGEDTPVDPGLCELLACDSFAVVPFNTRERAIGVLVVDNRITGIGISDADLQMLKVFANHAGTAIENSQLRQNLERQLGELAKMNLAMQENQGRLMHAERLSVIGEMAARVVHEIRNPLVSIGGFARLVRRGFDAEDPRSDYLRIISDEVLRLERIVQELLDFSRPQNRLDLKPIDLNGLVRELVAMATVEAESHGVEVREAYDDEIGLVRIDGDKTRQVLLNIIRNALNVMLDEGTLAIETAGVDASRFRVTVQDTGPGIPHEKREEVFEPGFTTRQDGTGFGLAISKRLVELQGGQITLRDSGPPGCTFDILLPRQVPDRPEAEERS